MNTHIILPLLSWLCLIINGASVREHPLIVQFPITSFSSSDHHSSCSNLPTEKSKDGWCSSEEGLKNNSTYLQVDLGTQTIVTSIITFKRLDYDQYVTSYSLEYSVDDLVYVDGGIYGGNDPVFDQQYHRFGDPIIARYLRIYPITFFNWKSLRMELIGEMLIGEQLPVAPFDEERWCSDEDFWCSTVDELHSPQANYVVDLLKPRKIRAIGTRGRHVHNQWVTLYNLKYSIDGEKWVEDKINNPLTGNNKLDNEERQYFIDGIEARFLKIYPITFHGWKSMRVYVYEYPQLTPLPTMNPITSAPTEVPTSPTSAPTMLLVISAYCSGDYIYSISHDAGSNYQWLEVYGSSSGASRGVRDISLSKITSNTILKFDCEGNGWGDLSYRGKNYPLSIGGQIYYFDFSTIVLPSDPYYEPLINAPCGYAEITASCGGYQHYSMSTTSGAPNYFLFAGIGGSQRPGYFNDITVFVEPTRTTKLKIECYNYYIATVKYNGQEYSTTNPPIDNRFMVDGNATEFVYYPQNNSGPQPLTSKTVHQHIAKDAYWICNSDCISAQLMTFYFDFSDIIDNIETCAPTQSPTSSPTESPTTVSPTEYHTSAPTITCALNKQTKSPFAHPPTPPIDYAQTLKGDQIIDALMQPDIIKRLLCLNEIHIFTTMTKMFVSVGVNSFIQNILCKTQEPAFYGEISAYISLWPTFYQNEEDCKVENVLKNLISKFLFTAANTETSDPEPLLKVIYENIKTEIDAFSLKLTEKEKSTTIGITYTLEFCLEVASFEFCANIGFGIAFDFNNQVKYYKTGSQGLSLESTPDFDLLPGSLQFSVSYDVLGEISYAPGNLYSIDASISPGALSTLINYFTDYKLFIEAGFSFSYLLGVDSLKLSDISTAKCLGVQFGKSLKLFSSALIPSVAFGISRAATKEIKDLIPNKPVEENNPTTWCINEQLFSLSCTNTFGNKLCIIRPDIEL